ncbi:MAG: hypothetical protein WDN69_30245 [Aliidongia sp.]
MIDYVPGPYLVESKSLKLFLASSAITAPFTRPARWASPARLVAEIAPVWLRIGGYWYPRGGIPIGRVLPDRPGPRRAVACPIRGVPPYRGRG